MRKRTIIIGILVAVILIVLASLFIPRLLKPEPAPPQTYWPAQDWRTVTPEEQGFDSGKLAELLQAVRDQNIGLDSLLIIRNGYLVLDATFYPYDNAFPHDLASVTKSVMTTLIGIAIDQGKIQLDQSMISFFPDRIIANLDGRKEKITVRHLVSNVNGFESGCMEGDMPTIQAMMADPDWVQHSLDRNVVHEPGDFFCYDSPGIHTLSAILQEATGMTALEFARQNLFAPLGISDVIWESDPQGYTRGWGDLHLKPRDAARIGYLFLNLGVWEGKQIVSAKWVEEATKMQHHAGSDDYGYGWWVEDEVYWAFGRGGQRVMVAPQYHLVIVTTASNFEFDQIGPMLIAAFVDPKKPLPANRANLAKLEAKVAEIAQATEPFPVSPLPDISKTISGKTYVFESNPFNLTNLRLDFSNPTEATLYLRAREGEEVWPIGLDGKFRLSIDGQALRGYWPDPQTLFVASLEIGRITYQFHFEENGVVLTSPELGLKLEGQQE